MPFVPFVGLATIVERNIWDCERGGEGDGHGGTPDLNGGVGKGTWDHPQLIPGA